MLGRRDILVLCYHAVSDSWPAPLATPAARLSKQLEFLVSRGYRGATFSEAVSNPSHNRTLVVSFDDAYRSTLTRGKPVLDRLGLPGTVFVPTAFPSQPGPMVWPGIDQWLDGPHHDELLPLTWAELSSLADAGWEIGSHTMTHPRLTQLDDAALRTELVQSRAVCTERVGACSSLAYPYGDVDERVVAATRSAGYSTAAALPERMHRARPLQWPRVGVNSVDALPRFAVKVLPATRWLRATAGV